MSHARPSTLSASLHLQKGHSTQHAARGVQSEGQLPTHTSTFFRTRSQRAHRDRCLTACCVHCCRAAPPCPLPLSPPREAHHHDLSLASVCVWPHAPIAARATESSGVSTPPTTALAPPPTPPPKRRTPVAAPSASADAPCSTPATA
eukprot:7001555-Prymnesium_polylepis.1